MKSLKTARGIESSRVCSIQESGIIANGGGGVGCR